MKPDSKPDTRLNDWLCASARFLVEATDAGVVDRSERTTTAHPVFRFFLRIGVPLAVLLIFRNLKSLRNPPRSTWVGDSILEDHASKPIAGSLARAGLPGIEKTQRVQPSRIALIRALFSCLPKLCNAYRFAAPEHPFDISRVLRLLNNYVFWLAVFAEHKPAIVCFVRTNSQKRIALGVVASEQSVPTLVWNVDRHGNRPPATFSITRQFCWSRKQLLHLTDLGVSAVQMPIPKGNLELQDEAEIRDNKLGLLLNARFDIKKLNNFVNLPEIRQCCTSLQIRPHPGSGIREGDLADHVTLRKWQEPLADYLDSIDAAICMTSGVLVDALVSGIPIVFKRNLDDIGQELTGLLDKGVIPELLDGEDPVTKILAHFSQNKIDFSMVSEDYTDDGEPELEALKPYASVFAGKDGN